MKRRAPAFTRSKYFDYKPDWHMKDGASPEEKKALEAYMNKEVRLVLYRQRYPKMKHPYYTWDGKIIDIGEQN